MIEFIIIAHDAFAMIDDACFFIALQTVQQFLHTVPAGEFRKSPGFDLVRIQPFAADSGLAFIAPGYPFVDAAAAHLAPLRILAPGKLLKTVPPAAFAENVL
jgi:hypothetical protein